MKYVVLILVAANAILSSQSVHGAECTFVGYYSCTASGSGAMPSGTTMVNNFADGNDNCAFSECKVYTGLDGKKYAVSSCSDAPSGRTGNYSCGVTTTVTTNSVTAGGCTMTYVSCVCNSCTRCTSTSWTAYGTGYETMTEANCVCGTCYQTTKYRCAAGYYGSSTNGTSGCTRCPSSNGVYGTSPAGSTSASSCCLAGSNVSFSDTVGSGTYTDSSCCYSN